MTIEITCPNCNYSKTVPREKIPEGVRFANCPRCKTRFEFAPPKPGFRLETGEEGAGWDRPPWENRAEWGFWRSVYQTGKTVLLSPVRFFGSMRPGAGIGEPFAFGLLLGSLGTMFGFFWQFLLFSGRSASFGQVLAGKFTVDMVFLGIIVFSPLFVILNMFLTGAIIHICLLIVRGAKGYFEGTFRAVAYCQTAQIFSFIPFIGGFIGTLWHVVILVAGLRAVHDTSYARVIIALLLPLGLVLLLVAAFVFSLVIWR